MLNKTLVNAVGIEQKPIQNIQIMNFLREIQVTSYLVARVILPAKIAMSNLVWLPLSNGQLIC